MINGLPHVKVSQEAMAQLQSNMKDNLTMKAQAQDGLVFKATTYGAANKTTKGPTATFRIRRTPLSAQIGMTQDETEACQIVDVHGAIGHLEGPEGAVFSVQDSTDAPAEETTVQAAGAAIFGTGSHTVEPFTYED